MSNLDRLLECFDSGQLVRPSFGEPDFAALTAAMIHLCGGWAPRTAGKRSEVSQKLLRLIGPAEHYVLVLIDGLGAELLATLPEGSFLRRHQAGTLQAVVPPTTATAMTTLATGFRPASHSIPGWWVYLAARELSITVLPFVERFSEQPLEQWGVSAEHVFPVPSAWAGVKRPCTMVLKQADSTFSRYMGGQAERIGYGNLPEAFEIVRARLAQAMAPSFTFVYLPHVDALAHKEGVDSPQMPPLLAELDRQLEALTSAGRARFVIMADHGLANTPPERKVVIEHADPLLAELLCLPTGEPTFLIFHTKPKRQRAFAAAFRERFGGLFALITPAQAQELELFGPEPLTPLMRSRLGSYIGIPAPTPAALYVRTPAGPFRVHVAHHAGLTSQEMLVPLILA